MRLGAVEYGSDGRVYRLVRFSSNPDPLDVLATGHRLEEDDVVWSERDQCYYRNSAGSWTGRIYLGKPLMHRRKIIALEFLTFSTVRNDEMLSAAAINELGFDLELVEKMPPFQDILGARWGNDTCYYCERCHSHLPERDPCDCVYWCSDCDYYYDRKTDQCKHWCGCCEGQRKSDCELYCDV